VPPVLISVDESPQSSVLVSSAVSVESVDVREIVLRDPKQVVNVGPAHAVNGQVFVENLFATPP
jgi:hypothetical protein